MAHLPAGHSAHHLVRGRVLTERRAGSPRRIWLDWARGVAVVLMVLAHVVDAWTRDADRARTTYYWATFIGGLAAPAFLFLAGLGTALAGASKLRAGATRREATLALARRGLIVFGLAFVFRAQSLALGWGAPIGFLKVDILNVMGPALVVAAAVWGVAASTAGRVVAASAATVALAMAAPLIRTAAVDRRAAGAAAVVLATDARPHQLHAGPVERVRLRRRRRRSGAGQRPHRARRAPSATGTGRARGGDGRCRLLGVVPTDDLPGRTLVVLGRLADVLFPASGDCRARCCRWRGACGAFCPRRWARRWRRWARPRCSSTGCTSSSSTAASPSRSSTASRSSSRLSATVAVGYGLVRLVPWTRRWVAALDQPPIPRQAARGAAAVRPAERRPVSACRQRLSRNVPSCRPEDGMTTRRAAAASGGNLGAPGRARRRAGSASAVGTAAPDPARQVRAGAAGGDEERRPRRLDRRRQGEPLRPAVGGPRPRLRHRLRLLRVLPAWRSRRAARARAVGVSAEPVGRLRQVRLGRRAGHGSRGPATPSASASTCRTRLARPTACR